MCVTLCASFVERVQQVSALGLCVPCLLAISEDIPLGQAFDKNLRHVVFGLTAPRRATKYLAFLQGSDAGAFSAQLL